ncbi:putative PHD finger domain protein [Aspergillus melleus]|uniref:putative PHD finger domain protein n=1 Tax=Aspergillus melleus TaxID=138277 RepID=UPI001E8E667D|nr:uncharacterized protein LDX57_007105 [Aspergillus melleus]KAH8429442.1 hypothetical protein LDX57_007105 [Aspergillus melleus]
MAPNLRSLRSSSHASASQSRPSTPADAPAPAPTSATPSFSDSTRPRKLRRTGLNSHVASDPAEGQGPPEAEVADIASEAHVLREASNWKEPPTRVQQTTWEETTWSGTNKESNSVLRSMRPLGEMPSITELRKQGFLPKITDPNDPYHSNTGEMTAAVDGANDVNEDMTGNANLPKTGANETETEPEPENMHEAEPQAVSESQTETAPETAPEPVPEPVPDPEAEPETAQPQNHLLTFMAIPVSASTLIDVEKVRDAIGDSLNVASESGNSIVARGLLRMWEKSQSDPFTLSILEAMCREEHDPNQRRAFNIMMRAVGKELRAEDEELGATALPRKRKHSHSSDSSLSSAKSLDVETFAPGMAATRAKGRHAKAANAAQRVAEPPIRHSAFPPRSAPLQRKRAFERSGESTPEAMTTKKIRLRNPLPPSITPVESRVRPVPNRTDLPPIPDSQASTPRASSPVKDAGARKPRPESPSSSDAEGNRRLTPTLSSGDERADNNDFCRECRGSGQLLCCDGCVNSFHFSCLSPPLDPANPPEGDWYCPRCAAAKGMDSLLSSSHATTQRDFALPQNLREYYEGVETGEAGRYQEVIALPRYKPRTVKGSREARYDDPFLLKVKDSKGDYIFCTSCGRTSGGVRPIIHCDFCPCAFHLDCLDPPLANPPMQKPGNGDRPQGTWMCPNHIQHDFNAGPARIRRPKNARIIDVEILPNEQEMEQLEEQHPEGRIRLRVKEDGIKLDFINRIRRENEQREARESAAAAYTEYAARRFDALTAGAQAFFASNPPAVPPEVASGFDTPPRTAAEQEAAANLIEFAQSNPEGRLPDSNRIGLLIDALRASAPEFPSVESEIEALRSLQSLIERRILSLNKGQQS